VCPRHYGHFAPQERGRWTEIVAAPVLVPTTLAPAPAAGWLGLNGTPAEAPAALAVIETLGVVDTLASES